MPTFKLGSPLLQMIAGAAQADVAILVVDATPNGFEAGFIEGGQTKEHAVLVRSLGVSELIVAVNKMDETGWSQVRFEEIQSQLLDFLKQIGFKPANVTFGIFPSSFSSSLYEKKNYNFFSPGSFSALLCKNHSNSIGGLRFF